MVKCCFQYLSFQEEYYKKLYEKEKDDHSVTISKLSEAETEIERLRDQLSKLTKDMEDKLLQAQLEVSTDIFGLCCKKNPS